MAGEKEKPLEKESLIIKYEHLNPRLQQMIGGKVNIEDISPFIKSRSIRTSRRWRASVEGETLATLLFVYHGIKQKDVSLIKEAKIGSVLGITARTIFAKIIQRKHNDLVKEMKNGGIIQPGRIESKYPEGWLNPSVVAKTHPVFYVKRNGDLIFPRMTRTEYARYVFQKRLPGKLGLNPWRWRAYLKPPERPEKVTAFVNAKIKEWLAIARRQRLKPALGIVTTTKKVQPRRKKHTRRPL